MTTKEALAKWVNWLLREKRNIIKENSLGREKSTETFRGEGGFTLWTISTD